MSQVQKKSAIKMSLLIFLVFFSLVFLFPVRVQAQPAISKTNITLQAGKSKTLKISGTRKKVKWSSNKPKIASVSKDGKVTAKSKGNAVITAKVGSKKVSCKVFVYKVSYSDSKVKAKACSVINKNITADMSTVEKIKAIHDYMVLNCEYDYSNYLKRTIPADSYSPRGVLLKKKAVCQGYAETFQLFMESLNIPCKIVTGTANGGGHAWNMVKVSGSWYQIDVTWDDPVPDKKGRLRYRYFLISDKQISDHSWDKTKYPKCKSSCNKFVKTIFGDISKSQQEAMDNLYKQYSAGKKTLILVYPNEYLKTAASMIPFGEMLEQHGLVNYEKNHDYGLSFSCEEYGDYQILYITPNMTYKDLTS